MWFYYHLKYHQPVRIFDFYTFDIFNILSFLQNWMNPRRFEVMMFDQPLAKEAVSAVNFILSHAAEPLIFL